ACTSCDAAAGLVASCWMNGRPGTLGTGAGAAGSAAAVGLRPSASPAAPAAAIMLVASIFLVNFMVLPIRCRHACARSYRVTGVTQVTRVAVIQTLRMRRDSVIVARVGRLNTPTPAAPTPPRLPAPPPSAAPA